MPWRPGTDLYLGLIHPADGADGARRRIDAAREHVDGFGVATECGWGRGGAAAVDGLLELHRELSAPLDRDAAGAVWPAGFDPVPDQPWTTERGRTPSGVAYDHVEGHGWYANLDPTVEDLAADLRAGDVLLDYSGGTGILLERLRRRIGDRRRRHRDRGPVVRPSCAWRWRSSAATRWWACGCSTARWTTRSGRSWPRAASTRWSAPTRSTSTPTSTPWPQSGRGCSGPAAACCLSSGNVTDPGGRRDWLLDQTVEAINERAQDLVRSDRTYERYEPLLQRPRAAGAPRRDPQAGVPRPAPAGRLRGRAHVGRPEREARCGEATIEASVHEWFDFLSAFHASVLGWIPEEAVHDRLRLMRQAMEVLFAQRPTFAAGWTYITAEKPA